MTLNLLAADPAVTQSQTLIKAHKYDEAVALLDKAHTANPKSAEIAKALTDAHLASATHRPDAAALLAAADSVERRAETNPGYFEMAGNRGIYF